PRIYPRRSTQRLRGRGPRVPGAPGQCHPQSCIVGTDHLQPLLSGEALEPAKGRLAASYGLDGAVPLERTTMRVLTRRLRCNSPGRVSRGYVAAASVSA